MHGKNWRGIEFLSFGSVYRAIPERMNNDADKAPKEKV